MYSSKHGWPRAWRNGPERSEDLHVADTLHNAPASATAIARPATMMNHSLQFRTRQHRITMYVWTMALREAMWQPSIFSIVARWLRDGSTQ